MPRPYGLTGIVSSGSTRLATDDHVLDAQVPAEHDQQDRDERRDQEPDRRALGDQGVLEEVREQVGDQEPLRAAHHRWCQELSQDRDEDEDAGSDQAGSDLRQQDVSEGRDRPGPEVLRRGELREVEALEGGVQDQRGERDVQVHEHQERPEVVVGEEQRRLLEDPETHQDLVERSALAEDGLPRVHAQEVARPERDDDDEQGDPGPASRDVAGEEVGDDERHDETDDRDPRPDRHGLQERPNVRRVREEVLVVLQAPDGDDVEVLVRRPHRVDEHHRQGNEEQADDDDHRRKERRELTKTGPPSPADRRRRDQRGPAGDLGRHGRRTRLRRLR